MALDRAQSWHDAGACSSLAPHVALAMAGTVLGVRGVRRTDGGPAAMGARPVAIRLCGGGAVAIPSGD